MECSFEDRKRELEAECKLPENAMAAAASRLDAFMQPFLVNYRRREQETNATAVVRGLCSDLEHKNGESIAYLFGLDRKVIQHFLGESRWDDKPLREELARQIGSQLGELINRDLPRSDGFHRDKLGGELPDLGRSRLISSTVPD